MTDRKEDPDDEEYGCGGYGNECYYCKYYHDPCFPEFDDIEDDEDA